MKKIFIAFVAVACALSACSDDDTADDLSRATISITPDAIPAGPDGTTTQVTVTSSGDWRLAGVCDWVHPSAEAGKSGDVVTFTIDPNTSEESREAAFKFFTGSAVAPLKIVSEAGYSLTLLSEENMTVEALSTDIQVKLHTNGIGRRVFRRRRGLGHVCRAQRRFRQHGLEVYRCQEPGLR